MSKRTVLAISVRLAYYKLKEVSNVLYHCLISFSVTDGASLSGIKGRRSGQQRRTSARKQQKVSIGILIAQRLRPLKWPEAKSARDT